MHQRNHTTVAAAPAAHPPAPRPRSALGLGRLLLLATLLAALLLAWTRPLQPGPHDPIRQLPPDSTSLPLRLTGRLLADARPQADGSCQVPIAVAGGQSNLLLTPCRPLQEGWLVQAVGQLQRPPSAPHPLLHSSAERLARQGIWSQLRVETLQVQQRPATPIADLRRQIATRLMAACGPARGGLHAALVLGSAVVPLPTSLRDDFRAAGLSHALAASGFHLSVLLGLTQLLGRGLGRLGRLGLSGAAMALFLLLAGPQPSVLRAVLMGALALVLLELKRRQNPVPLLLLTAAGMVLLQPSWLADVGFQLSVAATAGLLITARPLEEALQAQLPSAHPLAWLPGALAVPLTATLWTLPLQWLHFGALPLYAVPANLLAAPLLTPLTLGAMGLALTALALPAALPLLAWPVDRLADLLMLVAHLIAQLPMAQWQTGHPTTLLALLLALGLMPWLQPNLPRRWRAWGIALLALVLSLHLAQLLGDRLLLVHQGSGHLSRDLLLARHRGRAALISRRADGLSCRQASQLGAGLGSPHFDWVLLLDPLANDDPSCWHRLSSQVISEAEGGGPLALGESLASPGLRVRGLSQDSRALELTLGPQRWLLLPERQALWSWQQQLPAPLPAGPTNLWLGFRPSRQELQALARFPAGARWLSGTAANALQGWQASGNSGHLST